MMRLGRRASLLVASYLLISAATAYAECAWVLWEQINAATWSERKRHKRPFSEVLTHPQALSAGPRYRSSVSHSDSTIGHRVFSQRTPQVGKGQPGSPRFRPIVR